MKYLLALAISLLAIQSSALTTTPPAQSNISQAAGGQTLFAVPLSSYQTTGQLSGTFTNTTLGVCISGSSLTWTLPTGTSGNVEIALHGTISVNSLAAVIGEGLIVDGAFTDGETQAKGLSAPQEAVSTDGTNMNLVSTITGLAAGTHTICFSPFVSAGTGTIDSTNSVMKLQGKILP